ncbi:MAG TPA: GNAT family N-acetyltransferase [Trueperaceae bacterium]|nr:GNAT family N-acetyltransferase [Trueperaceae bacterium]
MSAWRQGDAVVDTDPARLDVDMMHAFLTASYWARGRSREELGVALANSLPFGLYLGGRQVGFARVVTDRLTFAYVADVFVLEAERGRGLGSFLMRCVLDSPETRSVRYWTLFTRDAHALYRRVGFGRLEGERLARFMIRYGPGGELPPGRPAGAAP